MKKVRVLIHNFEDKENKNLGLLQPGYEYEVTDERAKVLVNKKIVEVIKDKPENKENKEEE